MATTTRIEFANTLRGIAAMAVLVSHYFGAFWTVHPSAAQFVNGDPVSESELPTPSYVEVITSVPELNWGAFGVALFFIISGFVIPFSLYKAVRTGFVVNRVFRIFPTYAAGFTIALLALALSGNYFDNPWPHETKAVLIHYIPGLRDLLWSPAIDAVVWTLEVEAKFYLVCWLLLPLFVRGSRWVLAVPFALVIGGVVFAELWDDWNPAGMAYRVGYVVLSGTQMVAFMFVGVILHFAHRQRLRRDVAWGLIAVLFALFVLHWRVGVYPASLSTAWSYGLALAVFGVAFTWPTAFRSRRVSDFFADISYPLYVVHFTMGYALLLVLVSRGVWSSVALAAATALAILVAWAIHRLIERPTQSLGRDLGRRLATRHAVRSHTGEPLEAAGQHAR